MHFTPQEQRELSRWGERGFNYSTIQDPMLKAYSQLVTVNRLTSLQVGVLRKLQASLDTSDILIVDSGSLSALRRRSPKFQSLYRYYRDNYNGFSSWRANEVQEYIVYMMSGQLTSGFATIYKPDLTKLCQMYKPNLEKNMVGVITCGFCGNTKNSMATACVLCGMRGI